MFGGGWLQESRESAEYWVLSAEQRTPNVNEWAALVEGAEGEGKEKVAKWQSGKVAKWQSDKVTK